MKKAKVSELKNRLSEYLRAVRAGESVVVYDRDRPVARLSAVRDDAGDDAWIAELERQGVVRAPQAALPAAWLERRPRARADVVKALLSEREDGR